MGSLYFFNVKLMSERKNEIPTIQKTTLLQQIHQEYCADFENLFLLSGNGSLKCTNKTVDQVTAFTDKHGELFKQFEMLLNKLVLSRAGKGNLCINKGEIEIVNENKVKFMKLYGTAFQVYLKSCRFLNQQPKDGYADVVLIKWEE